MRWLQLPQRCLGSGRSCSVCVCVDFEKYSFGMDRLRRSEISIVVADALRYLCTFRGLMMTSIFQKVRTTGGVHCLIHKSSPKKPSALAWGFKRCLEFRQFTQALLTIKPSCRPLAADLEPLQYLNIHLASVDNETLPPVGDARPAE